MRRPIYSALKKRAIELSLPLHSSTVPISQRNRDIVSGRLSKSMKSLHPAKPWGSKEYFRGSGYYTNNAEGYVPRPESLVVPSRPPLAEQTAYMFPGTLTVLFSPGSVSLTACQLINRRLYHRKMHYLWPSILFTTIQACPKGLKLCCTSG